MFVNPMKISNKLKSVTKKFSVGKVSRWKVPKWKFPKWKTPKRSIGRKKGLLGLYKDDGFGTYEFQGIIRRR